jgi:hypothetical protein
MHNFRSRPSAVSQDNAANDCLLLAEQPFVEFGRLAFSGRPLPTGSAQFDPQRRSDFLDRRDSRSAPGATEIEATLTKV